MKSTPEPVDPFDMRGPGARLREAREAANIGVDRIANSLLLDPKIVEALEEDDFERLPAPTFVRGYLRGYARVLGVPAAPILDMYDSHGFKPPPLGPGISEAAQAHTSDIVVRIVTYAVAAVLVLLVGLWWHSQEDGGFGIAADLFSGWSEPATDSPGGIDEALGTESPVGETGATAASGEPPAVSRADDPQVPMLVEGSTPGDLAVAESAPAGPAGMGTVSDPDPLASQTSPAPSSEAADGVTIEAGTTPQTTATGDGSLAAAGTPGTEQTTEEEESDAATTRAAAGDDPGAAEDAAADAGSQRADRPATTGDAPDTATTIESGSAGGETPISPAARESAGTGPDSGAARFGLVLEFVHESWVEVYDGERVRLFFGLVPPGRVLDFDGPRPFDVLLGFGKDVRVTIDGEAFDLTPHIKHGVARFQIGATPPLDAETGAAESGTSAQPDVTEEPGDAEQASEPGEATEPETTTASEEATEPGETARSDEAEESGDATESDDAPRPSLPSPSDRGP